MSKLHVRHFRGRHLAVLALVGLVCLMGCGQRPPQPPTVDSLYVMRTSRIPQQHIPPFEATTQDVTKVQRVYNALMALPLPSATPPPVLPGPIYLHRLPSDVLPVGHPCPSGDLRTICVPPRCQPQP